jgi:hypothetical protein
VPRRRWRLLERRGRLMPGLRTYLALGPSGLREAHGLAPIQGYEEARWFTCSQEREAAWREHGVEILGDWVLAHPGSRPWGWWCWTATEPRRVVAGAELLIPPIEWVWRENLGVPALLQCRPRGYVGLPSVEAQAVCLQRLGLLGADERATLAADAFAPEAVDPFIFTQEELERFLPYTEAEQPTVPSPGRFE